MVLLERSFFWLKKITNYKEQDVLIKCIIGREEISVCHNDNKVTKNYLESVTHAAQLQGFINTVDQMIEQCFNSASTAEE